jgi:cobalt-zinc-cadmium efflux system outer membrane protein
MIRRFLLFLVLVMGCHAAPAPVPLVEEANVARLTPPDVTVVNAHWPAAAPAEQPIERIDLAALWRLALSNNPGLREAASEVEAARGRGVQAGLYPNPVFRYNQETIGSGLAPSGNLIFEVTQEIVTAGKRKLDMAIAGKETAIAEGSLEGRRFDLLTRIRRGYYDYLSLRHTLRVNEESVATLERGVAVARQQVEKEGTRPETDLIRLQALLEESRISRDRTKDFLEGAWRQLAADVGVPGMPSPADADPLPETSPRWDDEVVLKRTLAVNTAVKQAAADVERARLAVERARAGAIPNVVVGGGWNIDKLEQTAGGVVTVEAPIPIWNRQQGVIREAEARLESALAAVRSAENRLTRDVADALAHYKAAARQAQRLTQEVLPRLERSLNLTLKAYRAGSAQVTFSDVLTIEQNLDTALLTQADALRSLWQAIADLEGLMQLDLQEKWSIPPAPCPVEERTQLPPPRDL